MLLKLKNYGNNCYLNACIQGILSSNNFLKELKNYSGSDDILLILKSLSSDKYNPDIINGSTMDIHKNIYKKTKLFNFGRQEDSHELLLTLLDIISDLKNNFSNIFTNKYKYTKICNTCKFSSHNEEKTNIISLSINENHKSLGQCLMSYLDMERIKYNCDNCNTDDHKRGIYSNNISLADTLFIQLKRFDNSLNKNKTKINFPKKIEANNKVYIFRSVIIHLGSSLSSGHYITITYFNKDWIIFDDDTITIVDNKDLANMFETILYNSYIFVYDKIN